MPAFLEITGVSPARAVALLQSRGRGDFFLLAVGFCLLFLERIRPCDAFTKRERLYNFGTRRQGCIVCVAASIFGKYGLGQAFRVPCSLLKSDGSHSVGNGLYLEPSNRLIIPFRLVVPNASDCWRRPPRTYLHMLTLFTQ